jgi:hypothetical protein
MPCSLAAVRTEVASSASSWSPGGLHRMVMAPGLAAGSLHRLCGLILNVPRCVRMHYDGRW